MPAQPRTSGSRNDGGIELSLVLVSPGCIRRAKAGVFWRSSHPAAGLNASSSRLLANSMSNSRLVGKFILFLSKDLDARCCGTCRKKGVQGVQGEKTSLRCPHPDG